ncbi:MAG: hemerythrin family protein [Firmicutes bacterium]|nr:hemerythrin family protein [Bacillota bacterium]
MEWTRDLATGVELIDSQHKELIDRINRLFAACSAGRGKEEVGKTLSFLGDYVVFHFRAEEREMAASQYPELPSHKARHDRFVQDFLALKGRFEAEGPTPELVVRANQLLVNWLIQHIRNVDKRMAAYLQRRTPR